MSLESDLLTPDRVTEPATPPAEVPPQTPEPEPTPLNIEDEAAVDAALTEGAITPPDGEALIPSGTVGQVARAYRQQLKEVKAKLAELEPQTAKAQQLEARVAELEGLLQQARPYVDAYQQAAQQAVAHPAEPQKEPVPDAEAQQWAQRYDLYKPDGSGQLDLERAKDIIRDTRKMARDEARKAAQEAVQPLAQHTVSQQSKMWLATAKQTVLANGARPSEQALDMIWGRLDPSLTATKEGAQQAYMAALGYSAGLQPAGTPPATTAPPVRGPNGQFVAAQQVPEPVPRETSGGLEGTAASPLSPQEQRFLKQSGMSEADYLKSAQTAPWLRR